MSPWRLAIEMCVKIFYTLACLISFSLQRVIDENKLLNLIQVWKLCSRLKDKVTNILHKICTFCHIIIHLCWKDGLQLLKILDIVYIGKVPQACIVFQMNFTITVMVKIILVPKMPMDCKATYCFIMLSCCVALYMVLSQYLAITQMISELN